MTELDQKLFILGEHFWTGLYLLRIAVSKPLNIFLRRSKYSGRIAVSPGQYSYVGSAYGKGCPLPRRVVRHASKSGRKRPHPIRAVMLKAFAQLGTGGCNLLCRNGKPRGIYNVDHLLDEPAAELVGVYAIRLSDPGTCELRRTAEGMLGRLLMDDPVTSIFEPGLGAQDYKKRANGEPRQTHLLRVNAKEQWWNRLPDKLEMFRTAVAA